ncbi:anaerobic C4-dicarboxylate transporter [Deferribacterales bacterium RsTz2092]|nr:anaerobic C4-dicarboxylate transporter [Deferribacterales bacterium]
MNGISFFTSMSEGTQLLVQVILVIACLFYGARKGGIALGLLGGIGLVVLAFVFHVKPGTPATDVIFTILAVVVASATLQAAGGLDVMLQIAERFLRWNPRFVSIVAPLCAFVLTFLCGTGHVVYTLLPIVYDVAINNGIRPERPMAATTVSAQMGIIASPVSVAVVSLATFILSSGNAPAGFSSHWSLLAVTFPSSLCGVLAIGAFSWFRGKDLDKDEEFQERIKDPEVKKYVYGEGTTLLDKVLPSSYWLAMWIFLAVIAIVGVVGITGFRPEWAGANGKMAKMGMVAVIQMFMLLAGALIIIFTKVDANKISKNEVFRSGMIALVAVFGISWMAESMFSSHIPMMKSTLGEIIKAHPWTYAVMLLVVSKFVNSQAAAISAFVPLALSIGVPVGTIIAFAAACYGYYILPTYPSDLAAIQFDRSGTTHIGKFVINHSFILPGLIGVFTSCVVGYVLAQIIYL